MSISLVMDMVVCMALTRVECRADLGRIVDRFRVLNNVSTLLGGLRR